MRKQQMAGALRFEAMPPAASALPGRAAELLGAAAARFSRWMRRMSANMIKAQRDKAQREISSHQRRLSDDALLGIGLDAKQIEHMRAKGSSAPHSR